MLALDTSPIISLYLGEPTSAWVLDQIQRADALRMSTLNLAECLIILQQRRPEQFADLSRRLLTSSIEFIAPDTAQATLAADARMRYPLNLGDCFAYALARVQNLPLLTLDRDFRTTDLHVILPPPS